MPATLKHPTDDYARRVADLIRQAAEAAHVLHEAGIIHRDIKPGNILVSPDGRRAVLMDLGLAQLADNEEGRLTRTRQFVGTLRYASPQQVLAVGRLDRRTDVYSLGATLWELLALQPLFGATDQTPTPELMERIQRDEPASLRKHHPGLHRDLEAIAHKCLEKKSEDRYATAQEMADDLTRFLAGEPVTARPSGHWERSLKWALRHPERTAVYGLVVLSLALLLIGGTLGWLWNNAEAAHRDVEGLRRELAEKLRDSLILRKEQLVMFGRCPGMMIGQTSPRLESVLLSLWGNTVARRGEDGKLFEEAIREKLIADILTEAKETMRLTIPDRFEFIIENASFHVAAGRCVDAEQLVDEGRTLFGDNPRLMNLQTCVQISRAMTLPSREADALLKETAGILESVLRERPDFAWAWFNLAVVREIGGDGREVPAEWEHYLEHETKPEMREQVRRWLSLRELAQGSR